MSLVVRLAQPADLPEVFALRHAVFVVEQGVPLDLELDEDDRRCDHAVAVDGGEVVGTGRLLAPVGGVGTIGRLAVAVPARSRGVGAAVLRCLEQRAAERGDAAVELHAQLHARAFYERAGYRAHGDPYDEAGIEHVSMRKDQLAALRFAGLVDAFTGRDGVTGPADAGQRGFGSTALKVHGSIFAMLPGDQLVVKLPRARVTALVQDGTGQPFDAGTGTPRREWLTVIDSTGPTWHQLAEEAYEFVRAGGARPV